MSEPTTSEERLKEELASERVGHRAAASALYRVEAQRDETMRLLEKEHLERLSLCWPADDCRPCHEHRYYCAETLKGVCRFLAGLNTDTPKESA